MLRRYVSSLGVLGVQSVLSRGIGVLTTTVLARGLGATGLGAYNIAISTATLLYGSLKLGIDAAVHVRTAEADQHGRKVGRILGAGLVWFVVVSVIGASVAWLGAGWLATEVFGRPDLLRWIRWGAALHALRALGQFCYVTLAGYHQFGRYAVISVAASSLHVLMVLYAVGYGVRAALIATIAADLINLVGLAVLVIRALRRRRDPLTFRSIGSEGMLLMKMGIPFYAGGLVSIPVLYYAQGLLVKSWNVDALGHLRIIATLSALITFFPTSIAGATVSTLTSVRAAEGEEDTRRFWRYASLNIRVLWGFSLAMACGLVLVAPWVVSGLFGSEYLESSPEVAIAAVGAVGVAVLSGLEQILLSMKRSGYTFLMNGFRAVGFAALASLLIPRQGLEGFVVAEAAATIGTLSITIILLIAIMPMPASSIGSFAVLGLATGFAAAQVVINPLWESSENQVVRSAFLAATALTGVAAALTRAEWLRIADVFQKRRQDLSSRFFQWNSPETKQEDGQDSPWDL